MKPFLYILSFLFVSIQLPSLTFADDKNLVSNFFRPKSNKLSASLKKLKLGGNNNFNVDDGGFDDESVPIMELQYYGSWNSTASTSTKQFDYFSGSIGSAEFTAQDLDDDGMDDYILYWFYDGQYVDQKVGIIMFKYVNDTDFNEDNSTFKNDNITFDLYLGDQLELNKKIECHGSYQLSFVDTSDHDKPYNKTKNNYMNVRADFWLNSDDCTIALQSSVFSTNSKRESKALYYSLMVTLMCLGHLFATVQIIKTIAHNESDGNRYSLITLCLLTIWDVFMCLFHLYNALTTEDFFHYFITPAFWFFILSSIFETRLILIVWRVRYYANFNNINEIRRAISVFYLKFYGAMLVLLYLGYTFLPSVWFLSLTSAFFIPQIVHNALRGQRYKFDSTYIFLLGAVRVIIPSYVRSCPDSIFRLTPNLTFLEFYIGFLALQILILFLQAKFGSRFFIPSCFLPPKYNYYVKIDVEQETTEEEADACSICMDSLTEVIVTSSTNLLEAKPKQVTIMITPCRHKFHPTCLKQWMEIKLECPFCRAPIPSLD